ncbi:hypothetical protein HPB52_019833 [Rhipicephalus sanguineus]|uniref:Uncharacterized protein n=1 Tax=Rhipicephalus sanguineus TaxID=34632 RepID=A0A9D4T306_RHISA|nr:hypothetical protein HPB52_019833 [Rhipicephalus sanguineus]
MQLQATDEEIWAGRRPTGQWGGALGMLERNAPTKAAGQDYKDAAADIATDGGDKSPAAEEAMVVPAGDNDDMEAGEEADNEDAPMKESDISVHPVIPTADRLTVGTPLPAYVFSNLRFYAGTPNAYVTSLFGYLMSFEHELFELAVRPYGFRKNSA